MRRPRFRTTADRVREVQVQIVAEEWEAMRNEPIKIELMKQRPRLAYVLGSMNASEVVRRDNERRGR